MADQDNYYEISSILGGISHSYFFGQKNSYVGSSGIDPEKKINGRISGAISPTVYDRFNEQYPDALWLVPNEKNELMYFYCKDGSFGNIDSSTDTINLINTFTNGSGNGLAYYNNYYYIATDNDIARYGPLDGTPEIETEWWSNISASDFVIPGQNSTKTISFGGYEQISQSISNPIDFKKIKLGLKNVGADTNYNVKISVYEKDTTTKQPINTRYDELRYTVDIPGLNLITETTISALSNTLELYNVEFPEIISTNEDIVIVVSTENSLVSGQEFEVMMSEYGDVYSGGHLSFYDGSEWDKVPLKEWDTDTNQHSATQDVIYSYTINTKDNKSIKNNMLVSFEHLPESNTENWYISVQKNGSTISNDYVGYTVLDSDGNEIGTDTNSSSVQDIDLSGYTVTNNCFIQFTIRPEAELQEGDVIEIYGDAIDINDAAIVTTIDNYVDFDIDNGTAYFTYDDPTREEDMGLYLVDVNSEFTKLNNKTYPTVGLYEVPNHTMLTHSNNSLYFCDKGLNGFLNRINTGNTLKICTIDEISPGSFVRGEESGAVGEVVNVIRDLEIGERHLFLNLTGINGEFQAGEGLDIVNSTESINATVCEPINEGAYSVYSESKTLRLPLEYTPVDLEAIGSDVAVLGVKTTGSTNQGDARLFLWDTFDNTFFNDVELPYPIATAIKSHNGQLYIWGGDDEGYSLTSYQGSGYTKPLFYIDNGLPPLPGAIEAQQNRIIWGSSQEYPEERGCVWSWGSKAEIAKGLQNLIWTDSQVSGLNIFDREGNLMISDNNGFYKPGTDSINSVWRSEVMDFGQEFDTSEIIIGLERELEAGEEIDVIFKYDNEDPTKTDSYTIDGSIYKDRIMRFSPKARGVQNMIIEIRFRADVSIVLPIKVKYSLID